MSDLNQAKFDPYEFSISVQTLLQASFESQQALIVRLINKTVELHTAQQAAEEKVRVLEQRLADLPDVTAE